MAKTTRVSITEAKQHLGELVKQVAYGGETIVLEFRGKPQATIVPYEDALGIATGATAENEEDVLEKLRVLRESLAAKYGTLPDSGVEIRRMRDERAEHLGSL